ncbi:Sec-independent protein translocase protein TatB [Rhizobium paknamense]|uniref:Sec-independent protein translocase protein TatB n=1 Tax=Rhizobium paknamense TaxID=1206817 RepID=A0ABU0IIF7_9HYPH|nr:Sec-independent protein translocase protein TatB [Rhizobium paknamense]MDQ0457205.1 sec-independent protein translocase protein TatB [Rhizobium paknamense]
MLDIGWSELLVIAVVLIVVVGPKDLPPMLRAFGKMTTRLRRTAGEFRAQFEEALRESELDDVHRTISDAQRFNPANALREAINPLREIGQELKADLERSTQAPSFPVDDGHEPPSALAQPMTADDLPPLGAPAAGDPVVSSKPADPQASAAKPAAVTAVGTAAPAAAEDVKAKPARARKPKPAASDAVSPVAVEEKPLAKRRKSVAAKPALVAPEPVVEAAKPRKPRAAKPKAALEPEKTVVVEGEVITPKKRVAKKKPLSGKDTA